jgi:hypothetical protein
MGGASNFCWTTWPPRENQPPPGKHRTEVTEGGWGGASNFCWTTWLPRENQPPPGKHRTEVTEGACSVSGQNNRPEAALLTEALPATKPIPPSVTFVASVRCFSLSA